MRKRFWLVLLLVTLAFPLWGAEKKANADKSTKSGSSKKGIPIQFYWKDGLYWETEDGSFKGRIGGRLQNDWFWAKESRSILQGTGNFNDGTQMRRLRLFTSAKLYKTLGFKLQLDWAGGAAAVRDVYISLHFPKLKDLVTVQIGHFKRPNGLEELTSSKYITFLERSLANLFAPARDTGIMVSGTVAKKLGYALGVFKATNGVGLNTDEGDYDFSARFFAAPLYNKKGQVLHVGVSYSLRNNVGNLRTRPESNQAPFLFATGNLTNAVPGAGSTNMNTFGFELATVFGPFSFQAELFTAKADTPRTLSVDPSIYGYYVYASFFVTGEHRNYNPKKGVFGRIRPKKNFLEKGGFGAIEVALRFSYIDLDSRSIGTDARGHNLTFALNWYLSPNIRVMANYIWGWKAGKYNWATTGGGGSYDILQIRFQADF